MEFNSQVANWLAGALGGLASWVVIAACVLLVLNILARIQFLRRRGEGLHWLLDRSLVIRLLSLLFFIWVLLGFNSNGPKLELAPDYSDEQQATERVLRAEQGDVENFAPEKPTAAQTSQRLEELREQQKQESEREN
ncbi:hypothetical protein [Microbulbifer agarilyticus]|uniref:hypothetical protein n=1 Tax=Microbulbifer agarilyticus TaxID=260552 RepID=UPI001CD2B862|nr:hypothetical protein [Microbulbifer agarilyticus]MCA0893127.1 hypothetical protein [Microbulbifer agarilyticus]